VLQCVAVCCSVLQCVAVCCSVLQCVAVCCSVLKCVPKIMGGEVTRLDTLQRVYNVSSLTLQYLDSTHCNVREETLC